MKKMFNNKWVRVAIVALVAAIFVGVVSGSDDSAKPLAKSEKKVAELNRKIESLESDLDDAKNVAPTVISSQVCKDAIVQSIQLNIDYNTLVGHIGATMSQLMSNPYTNTDAILSETKGVTGRLAGVIAPGFACEPDLKSRIDYTVK